MRIKIDEDLPRAVTSLLGRAGYADVMTVREQGMGGWKDPSLWQAVQDEERAGNEALLRKEGDRLIVEPVRRPSVLELLASWDSLDEDFPEIEDPPPVDDVDL